MGSSSPKFPMPPEGGISRPLNTGKNFVLVIPKRPKLKASWDKLYYKPGDTAKLRCDSDRTIDAAGASIQVEQGSGDGLFGPLARLRPQAQGKSLTATYQLPGPVDAGDVGAVLEAQWSKQQASPGDELTMTVTADNKEGEALRCLVERRTGKDDWDPRDGWETVHEWFGSIQGNKVTAPFKIGEKPEVQSNGLLAAHFTDETLEPGATAWMEATSRGLDGQPLEFVLELQEKAGVWIQVGSGSSTVKDGKATVGLPLEAQPELKEKPPPTARFVDGLKIGERSDVLIEMDAPDGHGLDLELEQQQPSGEWVTIGEGKTELENKQGKGYFIVDPPANPWIDLSAEWPEQPDGKARLTMERHDPPGSPAAKGALGTHAHFVLERSTPSGDWEELGSTVSRVSASKAQVELQLAKPAELEKADYARFAGALEPGKPVEVEVVIDAPDGDPLELQLEQEQPGGNFGPVDHTKTEVKGKEGKAQFLLPEPFAPWMEMDAKWPDDPSGKVSAKFERHDAPGSDAAKGLAGTTAHFVLERLDPDDSWQPMSTTITTVSQGSSSVDLPLAPPGDPSALELSVTWPEEAGTKASAELVETEEQMKKSREGYRASFFLQRLDEGGDWVDVGDEQGRFQGGKATVSITLPAGHGETP